MAKALPIQEKTLDNEEIERFFRDIIGKFNDVVMSSTELLIENDDTNTGKIIETIKEDLVVEKLDNFTNIIPTTPTQPEKKSIPQKEKEGPSKIEHLENFGKFINDVMFGSLGMKNLGEKAWKNKSKPFQMIPGMGVQKEIETTKSLERIENNNIFDSVHSKDDDPSDKTPENNNIFDSVNSKDDDPSDKTPENNNIFDSVHSKDDEPGDKTPENNKVSKPYAEKELDIPDVLEEIKIENVIQTPILDQILQTNIVDDETRYEETVKWDKEIGLLEDIKNILLEQSLLEDVDPEGTKSGGGGGWLAGLMGGMFATMGTGIMGTVGTLFSVSNIMKFIPKFFGPAMIVASIGSGIIDGFKNYKEEGHLATAIANGLRGMIETATFGLFDFSANAQAGREAQDKLERQSMGDYSDIEGHDAKISDSPMVQAPRRLFESLGIVERKLPETLEETDAAIEQNKEKLENTPSLNLRATETLKKEIERLQLHRETLYNNTKIDVIRSHELDNILDIQELKEQKMEQETINQRTEKMSGSFSREEITLSPETSKEIGNSINVNVSTGTSTISSPRTEVMQQPFTTKIPNGEPSLGRYMDRSFSR